MFIASPLIALTGLLAALLLGALWQAHRLPQRQRRRQRETDAEVERLLGSQREALHRVSDSEKLLRGAEAVSRVGGFMIDLATGRHQWTAQTYRICDVDDSHVPSLELIETFLSPAVRARLHEALRLARESGEAYDLELPMVTAKERSIWIRMAGEVERENGVPVRIVGAIQDITDRCMLEQRLRDALAVADKASKSKSEFLANMSHEIRTPLNAVIGLGYLLQQTRLGEEQRQFLTKIQFAGRALLGVINNVLDLSKIEADEMSLEDEPFDLPEMVRDVSQMLLPQAIGKGIELIVEPAISLPGMVIGDASRVRQILTNLLHNSIKFTERGHVRLSVFCTEHGAERIRLRCEVKDTGIGIAPEACARLFTPFTQADASTTRRFGGTGLGLSIARRFVELMGGEIGVDSTVAVGSTFWIEIPLRIAPQAAGTLVETLRILIVDPNGDTPLGLGAMVRALGWNPQVVDSGEQMLAIMTGSPALARPDALIMDLHQNDTDAHRWIAQLAGSWIHGELPAIIVVAESTRSYAAHKLLIRPTDVLLVRPVTSSALFNAINLTVSRQPDSRDRVFESTNFDELHAQWLSGVRVLVVDDSDINLEVAQRILTKQGALVTTCSDGPSALQKLAGSGGFDVVLMDVQMPGLDGNEVTRRIRGELHLKVPIVALTAGALVGERQRALDAGMNDFVSKPFDPQILIRKARRLVEHARGEPVPMVFDERRAEDRGDRPYLKSIDAAVVQQMFGDDVRLFKSLLARMLRDYADFETPVEVPLPDTDSFRELKARAHKLKGSAGMIGASPIMRFAGAAERALEDSRPPDVVAAILRKLAAALLTLREEARVLLDSGAPNAEPVAGAPPPEPADLEELCALLEAQNLAAVDKFELLAPSLRSMLDPSRFAALNAAVENLDFQLGADVLRAAA